MPQFILDFVERNHLLGPRAYQEARLVVQLVIDLWAVKHQFSELIVLEVRIMVLLDLLHKLNLMNGSDYPEAQEAVVRVINEVLSIKNRVRDIIHAHGHYLSIDLVVEVE